MVIKTEKYGFIYIWYDRKHKRYYIGSHWGFIEDGYICSSTWMHNAFARRPFDFKRRILKIVETNRKDTFLEEQKWLDKIKDEELGKKYYNLSRVIPWFYGSEDKSKTVKEKISISLLNLYKSPKGFIYKQNLRILKLGKKHSEKHRKNNSLSHLGIIQSKDTVRKRLETTKLHGKNKGWSQSLEVKSHMREVNLGNSNAKGKRSLEARKKMSVSAKKRWQNVKMFRT